MGKEATIGLAVILILMITFGVVLVRRLNGSTEQVTVPYEEQEEQEAWHPAGSPVAEEGKGLFPVAEAAKPTWVTASPVLEEVPTVLPAVVGLSAAASELDNSQAKETGLGAAEMPTAAMMPDPSAPAWPQVAEMPGGIAHRQEGEALEAERLRPVDVAVPGGSERPYAAYEPSQSQVQQSAAIETAQRWGGRQGYGDSGDNSGGYSRGGTPWQQSPSYGPSMQSQQSQVSQYPGGGPAPSMPYHIGRAGSVDTEYTVRPNENYWLISERLYGSGGYFKALAEHNRSRFPQEDRLDVGDVILTPSVEELEEAYPELCPKPSRRETIRNRASLASTRSAYMGERVYEVEEGDTLFDIARHVLGRASRWVEIHELNHNLVGEDPGYITPGMQLVLPDEDPGGMVTRRPSSAFQSPTQQQGFPYR